MDDSEPFVSILWGALNSMYNTAHQGNMFYALGVDVFIYLYVTEGSFDAYMWGLQKAKLLVIEQVMAGEKVARSIEDVASESVLNAAEIQAITTGNPLVMEKVKVESELARLTRLYHAWRGNVDDLQQSASYLPRRIALAELSIAQHRAAIVVRDAHPLDTWRVELCDLDQPDTLASYDDRKTAYQAVVRAAKVAAERADALREQERWADASAWRMLGRYRGMTMQISHRWRDIHMRLALETPHGVVEYTPHWSKDPVGLWASVEHAPTTAERAICDQQDTIEQSRIRLAAVQEELARCEVFPHAERHRSLQAQLTDIRARLKEAGIEGGQQFPDV